MSRIVNNCRRAYAAGAFLAHLGMIAGSVYYENWSILPVLVIMSGAQVVCVLFLWSYGDE